MLSSTWIFLVLVGVAVWTKIVSDSRAHRPVRPSLIISLFVLSAAVGLIAPNGP